MRKKSYKKYKYNITKMLYLKLKNLVKKICNKKNFFFIIIGI